MIKMKIKLSDLHLDEKVDSIILSIDTKNRTVNLSIKELEIRDEKEALINMDQVHLEHL